MMVFSSVIQVSSVFTHQHTVAGWEVERDMESNRKNTPDIIICCDAWHISTSSCHDVISHVTHRWQVRLPSWHTYLIATSPTWISVESTNKFRYYLNWIDVSIFMVISNIPSRDKMLALCVVEYFTTWVTFLCFYNNTANSAKVINKKYIMYTSSAKAVRAARFATVRLSTVVFLVLSCFRYHLNLRPRMRATDNTQDRKAWRIILP